MVPVVYLKLKCFSCVQSCIQSSIHIVLVS